MFEPVSSCKFVHINSTSFTLNGAEDGKPREVDRPWGGVETQIIFYFTWVHKLLVIKVLGNIGKIRGFCKHPRAGNSPHERHEKEKFERVRKREPPTRSYGGFPLIQKLNGSAGQHHTPVPWHWATHRNTQVTGHTRVRCHNYASAWRPENLWHHCGLFHDYSPEEKSSE